MIFSKRDYVFMLTQTAVFMLISISSHLCSLGVYHITEKNKFLYGLVFFTGVGFAFFNAFKNVKKFFDEEDKLKKRY